MSPTTVKLKTPSVVVYRAPVDHFWGSRGDQSIATHQYNRDSRLPDSADGLLEIQSERCIKSVNLDRFSLPIYTARAHAPVSEYPRWMLTKARGETSEMVKIINFWSTNTLESD